MDPWWDSNSKLIDYESDDLLNVVLGDQCLYTILTSTVIVLGLGVNGLASLGNFENKDGKMVHSDAIWNINKLHHASSYWVDGLIKTRFKHLKTRRLSVHSCSIWICYKTNNTCLLNQDILTLFVTIFEPAMRNRLYRRVATCTQNTQLRTHCQRRKLFKMFKSAIQTHDTGRYTASLK